MQQLKRLGKMNIGSLHIKGHTFLAPLAGITNLPFRLMVKSCGCSVVCSEMISARGMFYNQAKTMKLLATDPLERPLSVQLFGADTPSITRAAKMIEEMQIADMIDINFGCSVRKVVKTGAGVALMKTPGVAEHMLKGLRDTVSLPLSIKIRSGWDATGNQAFEIAHIAQNAGIDAIAFHPRTATQGFGGKADWSLIRKLKQICDIPVIGNGDIKSPEDAFHMIEQTHCDAVMVGRASLSNPFLPGQIDQLINAGTYTSPDTDDIFQKMIELTQAYVSHFGEQVGCKMLRGRLSWFVRGWPNSSLFRKRLSQIRSKHETLSLIQSFKADLHG